MLRASSSAKEGLQTLSLLTAIPFSRAFYAKSSSLPHLLIFQRSFLIVFLSTLSGNTSWYEIEDYVEEYKEELKKVHTSCLPVISLRTLSHPMILLTGALVCWM